MYAKLLTGSSSTLTISD